jgi:hypothetical protein
MMRFSILNRLPLAPVIGAMFAVVAAILVLATPQWLFQDAIVASGLPTLFSAATPPLGAKAKILSAILAASIVGAIFWAAIAAIERLIESSRKAPSDGKADVEDAKTLDQILADRRRPIFAEADLGAPLMSDEAAAVARDELVLDTALPEVDASDTEIATPAFQPMAEEAETEPASSQEAIAQPRSWPPRDVRDEEGDSNQTVADLMSRLEAALDRRQQRLGKDAPMPGDISSLREALGLGARR